MMIWPARRVSPKGKATWQLAGAAFRGSDTVMMVAREQRPGAKSYFTPVLSDYALWYSLVMTNSRCPKASAQVNRPLQVRSMMSIN